MKTTEYSVKQLATLAGVSVRTLHHYDRMGLLVPALRTDKGYRKYGRAELLRLQQIMFFRELDFPLSDIAIMLDDADFDMREALSRHSAALQAIRNRIDVLLTTIDKTIKQLEGETQMTDKELYEGFPEAAKYRDEAIEKFGLQRVEDSELALKRMSQEQLGEELTNGKAILLRIHQMSETEEPTARIVQEAVAEHYAHILRMWGRPDAPENREGYKGLGDLYVSDARYLNNLGLPQPEFAPFLQAAMAAYATGN